MNLYDEHSFRNKIFSITGDIKNNNVKTNIENAIQLESNRYNKNNFINVLKSINNLKDYQRQKIYDLISPLFLQIHENHSSNNSDANNHSVLPNIKCFHQLPLDVLSSLKKNWYFTYEKHPKNILEHIQHFINLSKKQGRGDTKNTTALKDYFTAQLSYSVEQELKKFYNID